MPTSFLRVPAVAAAHPRWRAMGLALLMLSLVLAGCVAPTATPAPAPAQPLPTLTPQAAEVTPMLLPATGATATPEVSGPVTLRVTENADLGQFLVDQKGMTLYLYTKDTPNTSNCYDKCAAAWPPLYTTGLATAGAEVDPSLLGTTTRKDGKLQVTYHGWPLYYFAKDQKPGDVTGQEVGGVWYVVSPKGEKVEAHEVAGSVTPAAGGTSGATRAPGSGQATPQAGSSSGQGAGQVVQVAMKGFAFQPKVLTVAVGTTIEWRNDDAAPHTVTADDGAFDSGNMDQGATFKFTFTKAGTYAYYCRYHGGPNGSGMAGQVIVQ